MRTRISLLVALATSAVVVSFVIPLCLLVRTLAEDRAMAAADQEARNIAVLVSTFDNSAQLPELVEAADRSSPARTSLILEDDQVLGSQGDDVLSDPDLVKARAGEAFTAHGAYGGKVLLPVVVADGTEVVRSVVTPEQLHEGVATAWTAIIALGLGLLALAVVIASVIGRQLSKPLRAVAHSAESLSEGDFDARAPVEGPVETKEVARALNGLADRIVELLAAERAIVADLSHRLRTPVTALRLDAEGVQDPALASRLQDHIEVLQRDIDTIVNEARRPVRGTMPSVCDVSAVLGDRVVFWSALAEDQGREVTVDLPTGSVPVAIDPGDLRDLVDVLIDNVFAHTAEGVAFAVSLRVVDNVAHLVITDSGAGMGSGQAPGSRVGSTGLGLDIASRVATAVGGSVTTYDAKPGTTVEVRLPLD